MVYTVCQKTVQICFCQNFVKFPPILIIFLQKDGKEAKIMRDYSFSTSSNPRHHTTVLNADVRNCYTTLKVVTCSKLSNDLISTQWSKTWSRICNFSRFLWRRRICGFTGICYCTALKGLKWAIVCYFRGRTLNHVAPFIDWWCKCEQSNTNNYSVV